MGVATTKGDFFKRLSFDISGASNRFFGNLCYLITVTVTNFPCLAELLRRYKACIWAILVAQEFIVSATLNDSAITYYVDAVCVLDSRKAVSDGDRGPS